MRRALLTVILAFILLLPLQAAPRLLSIQPLTWNGENMCTTFSINDQKGYWSTALHCLGTDLPMAIAGHPVTAFMVNGTNDTAVLVGDVHAPALHLANAAPKPYEKIKVEGHPFGIVGLQLPFITTEGVFLNVFTDEDGTWNLYDISAGGGNSGSPVLSKHGVIGTLNFGWNNAGRLGGGTAWPPLKQLVDKGVWIN